VRGSAGAVQVKLGSLGSRHQNRGGPSGLAQKLGRPHNNLRGLAGNLQHPVASLNFCARPNRAVSTLSDAAPFFGNRSGGCRRQISPEHRHLPVLRLCSLRCGVASAKRRVTAYSPGGANRPRLPSSSVPCAQDSLLGLRTATGDHAPKPSRLKTSKLKSPSCASDSRRTRAIHLCLPPLTSYLISER
jgi:hypothetical protein